MIAAILIGRKGSQSFPGKNTYPVLGRPLAEYPVLAAKHSRSVDRMFISTDDEALGELVRRHGGEVIARPPELATSEALGDDVFAHAFGVIKEKAAQEGTTVEMLVLLLCNAATIVASTIDEGVAALRADPDLDSAVTVSCYNMWSPLRARRIDASGRLQPFVPFEAFGDPATLNCDRDSQGDVWFADMGLSVVRPRCLEHLHDGILPQRWMGQKIHPLKQWGGLDVDFQWQLPGVKYWLQEHQFTAEATPYDTAEADR